MSALNVNLDLVKKYNVAGPRYTSYPPATKFTDTISWEQLSAKIEENNRAPRDLSVYFHIPFCETLCWFCGCTTVITLNHSQGMAYVEALGREVAKMAPMLNPQRKAVQLHFGGGSPTFLRPDEIRRLGEIIHKHFAFSPDMEASVEVDPRRLTREHMVALKEIGFNRASNNWGPGSGCRGRGVVMKDDEAESKKKIEEAFVSAGLQVPALPQVLAGLKIDRVRAQKIVTLLLRDKILIKISDELLFHRSGFRHLASADGHVQTYVIEDGCGKVQGAHWSYPQICDSAAGVSRSRTRDAPNWRRPRDFITVGSLRLFPLETRTPGPGGWSLGS